MTEQQTAPIYEHEPVFRTLVAVEVAERTMRLVDEALTGVDTSDRDAVDAAIARARHLLDNGMERTTTTTCSLVKDQGVSDQISRYARRDMERVSR